MKKNKGFTLIELIIAVGIIGVLAGIAYPIYTNQVIKSNRADAIADLNDYAQRLQRCFTTNGTYNTAANVCKIKDNLLNGVESRGHFYTITVTISAATPTQFTLSASPISGRSQATDLVCSLFTLNQAGLRAAQNQSRSDTTAECWRN